METTKKSHNKRLSIIQMTTVGIIIFASGFASGYLVKAAAPNDAVTIESTVGTATPEATVTPDDHAAFTRDNVLIRMNEARLVRGLPQLSTDIYLEDEAAKDLKNNCPVTSHDNFENNQNDFRYLYHQVAEILNSGEDTPLEAINSFLASPTHADLMVGTSHNWKEVGISVVTTPVNCVSIIFGK